MGLIKHAAFDVKETIWFRISAWGKTGEVCNQYLKKGSKVLVEGRLTADPSTGGPRVWTGQDGSPRASFEVYAQTVRFLSSRNETAEPGTGGVPATDEGISPAGDEGDIPF
jgi:single-strand DNA-binding protein